jgi:hypothetical protein
MSKKKCEKKDYEKPEYPVYECKKCGRASRKEDKLCKPVHLNNLSVISK